MNRTTNKQGKSKRRVFIKRKRERKYIKPEDYKYDLFEIFFRDTYPALAS